MVKGRVEPRDGNCNSKQILAGLRSKITFHIKWWEVHSMLNRNYKPLMGCCNCHAQIKKQWYIQKGFQDWLSRVLKFFKWQHIKLYIQASNRIHQGKSNQRKAITSHYSFCSKPELKPTGTERAWWCNYSRSTFMGTSLQQFFKEYKVFTSNWFKKTHRSNAISHTWFQGCLKKKRQGWAY